jgi:uncharacterized protein YjbI with pentapeptide repeats
MSAYSWVDADFSGLSGIAAKFNSANIAGSRFCDCDLQGLQLKANNMVGSDFSRARLTGALFKSSNVAGDTFEGADLSAARFVASSLDACDFSRANLTAASFKSCSLRHLKLDGARLDNASFVVTAFADLTLSGQLCHCNFENCGFSRFAFEDATLIDCFFKSRKRPRGLVFRNCRADNITLAFLRNNRVDVSGIQLIESEA